MKVLKLSLLVLFAASLTTLLTTSANATDHPWDDSTVDSSTVTGASEDVGSGTDPESQDLPVIIKAKILIVEFLRNFFTLEVKPAEEVGIGEEDSGNRVEARFNWRKYRADRY
jgi:hypothetical protein